MGDQAGRGGGLTSPAAEVHDFRDLGAESFNDGATACAAVPEATLAEVRAKLAMLFGIG